MIKKGRDCSYKASPGHFRKASDQAGALHEENTICNLEVQKRLAFINRNVKNFFSGLKVDFHQTDFQEVANINTIIGVRPPSTILIALWYSRRQSSPQAVLILPQ